MDQRAPRTGSAPGHEQPPVNEADALDQAREVGSTARFDAPSLDGEASQFDALEQSRSVELDEDLEAHDAPDRRSTATRAECLRRSIP
jgi:hypothetical protein